MVKLNQGHLGLRSDSYHHFGAGAESHGREAESLVFLSSQIILYYLTLLCQNLILLGPLRSDLTALRSMRVYLKYTLSFRCEHGEKLHTVWSRK
jgi:hypothetical protein